jgi:hypothetical protein
MSFRGQASWAKMMSPRGKLTAPACHPTKKVNKADEPTYHSINIDTHSNILEVTVSLWTGHIYNIVHHLILSSISNRYSKHPQHITHNTIARKVNPGNTREYR